jgi:hypothetical protein
MRGSDIFASPNGPLDPAATAGLRSSRCGHGEFQSAHLALRFVRRKIGIPDCITGK